MTNAILIFCLIFAIFTLTLIFICCFRTYKKEKYKKHVTYYMAFTFPETRQFRSLSQYTTPILQKYHIRHIYAKYKISHENPKQPMVNMTIKIPDKSETPISVDTFRKVYIELKHSLNPFLTSNHTPKLWMTVTCNGNTDTYKIDSRIEKETT